MTLPSFSISIKSLKKDFIFIALPFFSLGVSALLLVFLIIPGTANIRKDIKLQKTLKKKYSLLASKRKILEGAIDQEKELDSHLKLLTNALPLSTSVPGLMSQVENIASKSAVSIKGLQFAGKTDYLSGRKEEKAVKKTYQQIILQVGVDCSLDTLEIFLKNLENSSRIVSFKSFKFSPIDEEIKEEGVYSLKASIGLTAFYQDKPKAQAVDKEIKTDLSSPVFLDLVDKIKSLDQHSTGENLSF